VKATSATSLGSTQWTPRPERGTPVTDDSEEAQVWFSGRSEGVVAKQADAPYKPGERTGMLKIKRVRTADTVVIARTKL